MRRFHSSNILSALGGLLCTLLLAWPASAHHGWAGNSGGEIEITGEVVSGVSLSGPHGTMQIRDHEGRVWDITLAPGPRTNRAGLRDDTLPVGAEVTVIGERNQDPERNEAKVRRVIWDGREFDVYPPK